MRITVHAIRLCRSSYLLSMTLPRTPASPFFPVPTGFGKTGILVAAGTTVASVPIFMVPYHYHGNQTVMIWMVSGLYGTLQGLRTVFVPWTTDLFPREVRATAVSLYACLAHLMGGLPPTLMHSKAFAAGWFTLSSSLMTLVAMAYCLLAQANMGSDMWPRVTYLRDEPY